MSSVVDPLSVCLHVAAESGHLDLRKLAAQLASTSTTYYRHPGAEHLRRARHLATARLINAHASKEVRDALDGGADPNAWTRGGCAIIHHAALRGFVSVLTAHPDFRSVDAVNDKIQTALHETYFREDTKTAEQLLRAGADANMPASCGCALIHFAAERDHLDFLTLLARFGANLDVPDCRGNSPLHLAISGSSVECIDYLLSHGADRTVRNKQGLTPIAYAVLHEDIAVDALLAAGVKPDPAAFRNAAEIGAVAMFDALAEHADGPVKFKRYARLAWEQGHTVAARTILESYCDGF